MLIKSKEATFLQLILFGYCQLHVVFGNERNVLERNKKQFSLFSVVTFKNEECSSESSFSGGQLTGTCYSTTECSDKGGTMSGHCASGFGVCCIFLYTTLSSTTITQNRTYVQNPEYPNVETSGAGTTTSYTINKCQSDICQVRLDFDYFVIAGPAGTGENGVAGENGNCNDKLTMTSSSGFRVPILCGSMTSQHVYVDVGMESTDNLKIDLYLAVTTTVTSVSGIAVADAYRKWRIKASQITCWATYRAPAGCHQYFTSIVGQIISPNFAADPLVAHAANAVNTGKDLMEQDMRYCIRRETNYCCVLYQVCNEYSGITLSTILLGGTAANGELAYVNEGWSFHTFVKGSGMAADQAVADNSTGRADAECTTDYLEIPDSTTGLKAYGANVPVNSRYCGHKFGYVPAIATIIGQFNNAPVWDCTEPFEANYFTDQQNDAGANAIATPPNADTNRGMCLDFRQQPC